MSTHPYIPLYVDDYDAHTGHLTPEEDGMYGRLLRLAWRTPGCSLPNDLPWIKRKVRAQTESHERVVERVIEEFFRSVRGRLVQKRLRDEYADISRKKSARKEAGKKGGKAKALKTQEERPSIATVLPQDTRAFPEPEPKPERIETTTIAPDRDWKAMIAQAALAAGKMADMTRPLMHSAADLRPLIEPLSGEPCTWAEALEAITIVAIRQGAKNKPIQSWKWIHADAWALRDKRLNANAPPVSAPVIPFRAGVGSPSLTDKIAADNDEARRRTLAMLDEQEAKNGR